MAVDASRLRPSYVPRGYRFLRAFEDRIPEGFHDVDDDVLDDQVMLVYGRGGGDLAGTRPLLVYLARRAEARPVVLFSTEKHRAGNLDLGLADARAIYHDGVWALGSGNDARQAGDVVVHWDATDRHSLTVERADVIQAVRGARNDGVSVEELLKVARSLPAAATS